MAARVCIPCTCQCIQSRPNLFMPCRSWNVLEPSTTLMLNKRISLTIGMNPKYDKMLTGLLWHIKPNMMLMCIFNLCIALQHASLLTRPDPIILLVAPTTLARSIKITTQLKQDLSSRNQWKQRKEYSSWFPQPIAPGTQESQEPRDEGCLDTVAKFVPLRREKNNEKVPIACSDHS